MLALFLLCRDDAVFRFYLNEGETGTNQTTCLEKSKEGFFMQVRDKTRGRRQKRSSEDLLAS